MTVVGAALPSVGLCSYHDVNMRFTLLGFACASVTVSSLALAQEPLPPPAPAPPPAQYQPPPSQGQPPPANYNPQGQYPQQYPPQTYPQQAPPPGYGQPAYGQPAPPAYRQDQRPAPEAYAYTPRPAVYSPYSEAEAPTHAPKYSLWVGPRLSYMGFGFSFFENRSGRSESTGNFVGNGLAPQIDIGARISRRYIPHLFWEHGFLAKGHRFEGDSASASTDYYGIGFRYLSGDVDAVAFLTDISIGKRVITVTNNGETYKMSGLEFFRLGLGAEIRVQTLFTIEPVFSISTGTLNDTEGTVKYSAEGSKDGNTEPAFKNGETIENTRPYVMVSVGVGIHFDLFGQ